MLRSLLLFVAFWIASASMSFAEGKWTKDVGRGWYYHNHGQVYFWVGGTAFQPVSYWWFDSFNNQWVKIDRLAFFGEPYYSSYGFVSPFMGYHRDRGGHWRTDDWRGGYDWKTDSHHRIHRDHHRKPNFAKPGEEKKSTKLTKP